MFIGRQRQVEVHCWGGLGSQLFALALIHDLEFRFPSRNFTLVLHSSGVTERAPEIANLPFPHNFKVVDDFSQTGQSGETSSLRKVVRRIVKKVVSGFGIVASGDTDLEFRKIRPWVRQIRGHYSRRTISNSFLIKLETFLNSALDGASSSSTDIAIHYRLGDLLALAEKSPITVDRIATEVIRIQRHYPGRISLFSDSPQTAFELLANMGVICDFSDSSRESLEVINLARSASYFIGTSSKISYWVVCLRHLSKNQVKSSMPSSDEQNLSPLIGGGASKLINYY